MKINQRIVALIAFGISIGLSVNACVVSPQSSWNPNKATVTKKATLVQIPRLKSCTLEYVEPYIKTFIQVFNQGDYNLLEQWFDPHYVRYGVHEGPYRLESDRIVYINQYNDLVPYFAERHEKHEALLLESLQGEFYATRNTFEFSLVLRRSADDIPANTKAVEGKGYIDCATSKIAVWSMGPPEEET